MTAQRIPSAFLLRKALRLVHCLQQERGLSCANSVSQEFKDEIRKARFQTDHALTSWQSTDALSEVSRTVQKIRDRLGDSQEDKIDRVHQILQLFNTIVGSVIDTYVLNPIEHQQRQQQQDEAIPTRRNRTSGNDDNDREKTTADDPKTISLSSSLPSANVGPATALSQSVMFLSTQSSQGCQENDSQISSLLSLIEIFVRLKESAGYERALLSSMFGFRNVDRRLLNDLVLEVENQYKLIQKLQEVQLSEQHSLVQLLQEGVLPSPSMAKLQKYILTEFDLKDFQQDLDMKDVWTFSTTYMDRLHSLELLLIEEVECEVNTPYNSEENVDNIDSPVVARDNVSVHQEMDQKGQCKDERLTAPLRQPLSSPAEVPSTSTNPNDRLGIARSMLCELFCRRKNTSRGETDTTLVDSLQSMAADEVKLQLVQWVVENSQSGCESSFVSDNDNAIECSNNATTVDNSATHLPTKDNKAKIAKTNLSTYKHATPTDDSATNVTDDDWEVDLYELQFLRNVGRGSAGTTYLGKWRGQQVAVKVATINEMGLEGWKTEMSSLRKLHHTNIIRLMGSVYHESPLTYCLVLEYCNGGDLEAAMAKTTPSNFFIKTASDIAHGLAYLHSRGYIHRDIKPSNVLLHGNVSSGDFIAKVSDFGMAVAENRGNMTSETGTYRWMAPEVIQHKPYSGKADIYSFAVVMWQLLTRQEPFCEYSAIEAAGKVALEDARPRLPGRTPQVVQDLIERSWRTNPDERPNLVDICDCLGKLTDNLTPDERKWLSHTRGHPVHDEGAEDTDGAGSAVNDTCTTVSSPKPKDETRPGIAGKKPSRRGTLFGRRPSWRKQDKGKS